MTINRRKFITTMLSAGVLAPSITVRAFNRKNMWTAPDISREMDENLFVFISDLHCNPEGYQADRLRKVVQSIISMNPLPSHVIALGDLAYLTGKVSEYEGLKKILQPIEDAGIKMTLGMGNHDRRETFRQVFPSHAKESLLPDRYLYKVEHPYCDFIILDSLQQGEDTTTWITPGALSENQVQYLEKTLPTYPKPVFVCAHHPLGETKISTILVNSPACCGYIYGHTHRWDKNWIEHWSEGAYTGKYNLMRTLCMPSTGHWGDIGYCTMRLMKDGCKVFLHQDDFFFPTPAPSDMPVPERWKAFVEENQGDSCYFPFLP